MQRNLPSKVFYFMNATVVFQIYNGFFSTSLKFNPVPVITMRQPDGAAVWQKCQFPKKPNKKIQVRQPFGKIILFVKKL